MINPRISESAKVLQELYNSAPNYPHIVLDNFIDETILEDVSDEAKHLTDSFDQEIWRFGESDYHEDQWLKRGITETSKMTGAMNLLTRYLNNDTFLDFLKELTGIPDLIADWDLEGGGFHVTYPEGLLTLPVACY